MTNFSAEGSTTQLGAVFRERDIAEKARRASPCLLELPYHRHKDPLTCAAAACKVHVPGCRAEANRKFAGISYGNYIAGKVLTWDPQSRGLQEMATIARTQQRMSALPIKP